MLDSDTVPPVCDCTTKVPTPSTEAPSTDTLLIDLPAPLPSMNWIASYGEATARRSVTRMAAFGELSRASTQKAPTPNCQFGSRAPARTVVLCDTVIVPDNGVALNRLATRM